LSTIGDAGMVTAFKAQRCNVPGRRHAVAPAVSAAAQLDGLHPAELWPNLGAYSGGVVTTGMYTIGGADAAYNTCGVCGRALGDKTQASQKEYFATGGMVNVTAVGAAGQPISATLTNLSFVQVDATTKAPVASGCMAMFGGAQISGTVMDVGGGGGGGGACPTTVGD
jgi:hypothetical protein